MLPKARRTERRPCPACAGDGTPCTSCGGVGTVEVVVEFRDRLTGEWRAPATETPIVIERAE